MPVIVLAGDEDFELGRRLEELKSTLLDPAWASVNFQRLPNPGLPEIMDAAMTMPFGPGNRLVLIDSCELFTRERRKKASTTGSETGKGKKDKSKDRDAVEPEEFETALAKVGSTTYLIFACPHNFDSTLKISKAVSKVAKLESFPKEKYWPGSHNAKLATWCQKEAHRFAATIDDEAIRYLLDSTEANLRQVSSEIQKAAVTVLPGTHISYDLVLELSPHHSNVFALADKWLTGAASESLTSLQEILQMQSGMPVLAALQTLLSKWIRMKVLCDKLNSETATGPGVKRRELSLPELTRQISSALGLVPFIVERDLRKLSKIPTERLIRCRAQLTHFEHLLKTGQMPERHALELFTVTR